MNIASHDKQDTLRLAAESDTARRFDDPTPAEIRLACLRIQATWTEEERRYRAGLRDPLGTQSQQQRGDSLSCVVAFGSLSACLDRRALTKLAGFTTP